MTLGTLIIHDLDEALEQRLRLRATENARSMEDEVRHILHQVLSAPSARKGFGTRVHERVIQQTGGFDLPLPARTRPRQPPDFGVK
ncbi:MAG: hypothetical protein N838_34280 [Thiohalocapsa sp. PB-PSB1]|jgi:plasmid stability protein|nr:MAG: hypothetical protein N838_34280 [Thiohalocapsa sp. PB-PSB1]